MNNGDRSEEWTNPLTTTLSGTWEQVYRFLALADIGLDKVYRKSFKVGRLVTFRRCQQCAGKFPVNTKPDSAAQVGSLIHLSQAST